MNRQQRDTILISAYETIAALAANDPTDEYGHTPRSTAMLLVGLTIDRAWTDCKDLAEQEVTDCILTNKGDLSCNQTPRDASNSHASNSRTHIAMK